MALRGRLLGAAAQQPRGALLCGALCRRTAAGAQCGSGRAAAATATAGQPSTSGRPGVAVRAQRAGGRGGTQVKEVPVGEWPGGLLGGCRAPCSQARGKRQQARRIAAPPCKAVTQMHTASRAAGACPPPLPRRQQAAAQGRPSRAARLAHPPPTPRGPARPTCPRSRRAFLAVPPAHPAVSGPPAARGQRARREGGQAAAARARGGDV
jgi:hypothetical protein